MSFVKIKSAVLCLAILLFPLRVNAEPIYHGIGEGEVETKRIAFTFDDGPHYKYTEEILDILAENEVRATFFTVGENAKRFPDIIDRELADGHEVANHTFSHKNISALDEKGIVSEIEGCEDVLFDHDGYSPELFRPVEGYATDEACRVIEELGYEVILWSVDTRDWAHSSVEDIVNNVLNNSNNGSIVLFHDFVSGSSPTPEALRILIPKLKSEGFEFVTVSELLNH